MGKPRHEVGKPTSLNVAGNDVAWAQRMRAEDRIVATNRFNLSQLGVHGAFNDRPQRPSTSKAGARPRAAKEPQLEQLHRLLRTADAKETGVVGASELRFIASRSGLDLEDERTAELLTTSQVRRSGQARYSHFEEGVRQHLARTGDRPQSSPGSSRGKPPVPAPDDGELVSAGSAYQSALFLRYKARRMLTPANLQLSEPPHKLLPNTAASFYGAAYRSKQRSLHSWQAFRSRVNVLNQTPYAFPGLPSYAETGLSTCQLHYTHGGPHVEPGAYSAKVRPLPKLKHAQPPARSPHAGRRSRAPSRSRAAASSRFPRARHAHRSRARAHARAALRGRREGGRSTRRARKRPRRPTGASCTPRKG